MKKSISLVVSLLLLATGCKQGPVAHNSRYYDDGREKPKVAFMPVFNCSGEDMPWDLSEEFTHALNHRFFKNNSFFLSPTQEIASITQKLSNEQHPFTQDISWIKNAFASYEFVIFVELVEHNIHEKQMKNPVIAKITPSSQLDMTARLRVVDIREEVPKVILQELVHQSHLIPKMKEKENYTQDHWKKKSFFVSPIGFAHLQMNKEIATRVEDYIRLAKSSH